MALLLDQFRHGGRWSGQPVGEEEWAALLDQWFEMTPWRQEMFYNVVIEDAYPRSSVGVGAAEREVSAF